RATGRSVHLLLGELRGNEQPLGLPDGELLSGAGVRGRLLRLPTEGLHSKDWSEFAKPGAPRLDFVFTVCDNAAGEVCPVWPGQPITAHWGVEDPSLFEGTEEAKMREFSRVALILKRRIELFTSLPLAKLDRLVLQKKIQDIGRQ
ncbi:MAG: arsenate reductase ArsC, partial [Betaproteobacteria bacterium]